MKTDLWEIWKISLHSFFCTEYAIETRTFSSFGTLNKLEGSFSRTNKPSMHIYKEKYNTWEINVQCTSIGKWGLTWTMMELESLFLTPLPIIKHYWYVPDISEIISEIVHVHVYRYISTMISWSHWSDHKLLLRTCTCCKRIYIYMYSTIDRIEKS